MAATVRLRPAGPDDRGAVASLLESCGLPTADLDADPVRLFVCDADGERVGTAGVELHGAYALCRSIAVEPSATGRGYGTAIAEGLLERARDRGATRAYLLTTSAADFFRGLGFDPVARESVPDPIRETTQFRDVCPSTATCMRYALD